MLGDVEEVDFLGLEPAAALKSEFPWRPTKGGVGIRRKKRTASAYPYEGIDWNMGVRLRTL